MLEVIIHKKAFENKGVVKTVLRNVKLKLNTGEFYSLLGESGIGKTSLLKIIARLDSDFDGSLTFTDKKGQQITSSMVFQEHRLLPWKTVEDNLFFVLPNSLSKEEKIVKVDAILDLVGLRKAHKSWIKSLSGGMLQRVSIARALIVEPELLLLDEPFSSLDQFTKRDLMKRLQEIVKLQKLTCVMVTHDFNEAIYLSDKIGVLQGDTAHLKETKNIIIENRENWASLEFNKYRAWLEKVFFGYEIK